MNDIKEIMANAFICADYRCYEGVDYVDECMVEVIEKLKLEGFVIVPIEPDNAMQLAANEQYGLESDVRDEVCRIYKAMIEASQGGDV